MQNSKRRERCLSMARVVRNAVMISLQPYLDGA
jgi:hypothetical protein